MGCDHRDNAAGAKNEPATTGLGDGIYCFFLNLGSVPKNNGSLTYSTADYAMNFFHSLRQCWRGFAVVPVDNLKKVIREPGLGDQVEVNV